MPKSVEEKLEKEFHISWFIIAYKFGFGLVEFLLGAGIMLFSRRALMLYHAYAVQEFSEDPHDLLVRLTENVVPNLLAHHTFLALYLIILGGAKMAGAVGLLFGENWGVDLLVSLTILMFPFQFIQLLMHPSLADFAYIFIGLLVALYLVNFRPHEWASRVRIKLWPPPKYLSAKAKPRKR